MSTLVQFEPLVDSTITAFVRQIEHRFANRPGDDGVADFGTWLHYYAFDVIGELTFSKRLGFIDEARDVEGIIGTLEKMLDYFAVVSWLPFHLQVWHRMLICDPDWPNSMAGSAVSQKSYSSVVQRPRARRHYLSSRHICEGSDGN
jgi:hypothetical protein